ncbi:MAG: PaaX family transcriptional regulator C-terminal domain-containing protein [Pseudomonadota bacterium]
MDAVPSESVASGSAAGTERLIEDLIGLGDLRVWSVIITVFGDSIQPRGGTVATATLTRLVAPMGIRPEALRVALHRLVRDGWLLRLQEGRNSFYRLSQSGLERFAPATQRIYAATPAPDGPWRIFCGGADTARPPPPAVALQPGLFLGPAPDNRAFDIKNRPPGVETPEASAPPDGCPDGCLVLDGAVLSLPGWARAAVAPAPLPDEFARLEAVLGALGAFLRRAGRVEAFDAIVLRTLLVHRWRRLLLRHPDLPARFFPEGWRGEACRALFLELHARLSLEAVGWLDREIGQPR